MSKQYTRRERREYWTQVVEQWRTSGVSKKAFCEARGLSYYTFLRWTTRFAPTDAEQRFVEVSGVPAVITNSCPAETMIELDCGGITVRVPASIGEHELSRVLRAVEDRRC